MIVDHQNEMRLVSLIDDPAVIERILTARRSWRW